ncbi:MULTISPECIES: hypothetical protein [unclassified Mesorhizobium]|uniref:hypothetical protein n=1 Tax=unclassified Mesorhizobium TaxID=325217 RepID=UPI000F759AA5|nr:MULTISPECIES: hypothetical protein [unclassified Mesorhizobium]AZO05429.1 hypothetical protein EJ068_21945 [Mesorhizobium sp. M2A.F.Ca.ET.043.02.1.1]RUW39480.1 hypothetical protein EOA37_19530 [Mesorhizobium sp. M2A.F.Ca.ET.015.02.1.1]RUW76958.1 hypothetical protein EOA28_12835 [Mesorhizobium sp. M2A.F.Ca.ET.067.02.1.1]RVC96963.1 hypothetical protein EN739_06525 [Mesorhizobium sp. M2A.F.Ca.ET.017.03.2.1]RVD10222.1 hypothetical protein EN753_07195 [Mesorhizobium sp. M2A.F.Ca.ET.029.05.1.1]
MALLTLYDTQDGIKRLLNCMFDLDAYSSWYTTDKPRKKAAADYQQLFDAYVQLIQQAYNEAAPWWDGTVEAERNKGLSDKDALEAAFNNRMAGPASDPRVVWIVRVIWLECANRNAMMADSEKIRPEYLLLQWLIDAEETELVRLIACIPYWPVGLDENGNWC